MPVVCFPLPLLLPGFVPFSFVLSPFFPPFICPPLPFPLPVGLRGCWLCGWVGVVAAAPFPLPSFFVFVVACAAELLFPPGALSGLTPFPDTALITSSADVAVVAAGVRLAATNLLAILSAVNSATICSGFFGKVELVSLVFLFLLCSLVRRRFSFFFVAPVVFAVELVCLFCPGGASVPGSLDKLPLRDRSGCYCLQTCGQRRRRRSRGLAF